MLREIRSPRLALTVTAALTLAVLAAQLGAVRPALTRRSDAVLAGLDVPRSHAHHVYIALELAKVILLLATGILALSSGA